MTALLLLTLTAQAQDPASCEPAAAVVAHAEGLVVDGRFDDFPAVMARFDEALSCGPPVDPLTLAAFLRATGAWLELSSLPDEAELAFRSAARLDPSGWTPAFGSTLKARFDAAAGTPPPAEGAMRLAPPPSDPALAFHLDGVPSPSDRPLSAGLHAVQLVRTEDAPARVGEARFGRLVTVQPGEDVVVDPGILGPEEVPTSFLFRPERPHWLLGAAGTSIVAGVVAGTVGRLQGANLETSTKSIADVNTAESKQQTLAVTGYTLLGLGTVGTAVYFAF